MKPSTTNRFTHITAAPAPVREFPVHTISQGAARAAWCNRQCRGHRWVIELYIGKTWICVEFLALLTSLFACINVLIGFLLLISLKTDIHTLDVSYSDRLGQIKRILHFPDGDPGAWSS